MLFYVAYLPSIAGAQATGTEPVRPESAQSEGAEDASGREPRLEPPAVSPDRPEVRLLDNRETFPRLLELIARSQRSIQANIHIWRDDRVGNEVAGALLQAADRGVKISISKDLVGAAHERAEETGQSLLHKKVPFKVRLIQTGIELMYPAQKLRDARPQRDNPLARALAEHPSIVLEKDLEEFDHAKYFIFDDEVLLVGGVNLEDKELYQDINGLEYYDFMVEVRSPAVAARFRRRLEEARTFDPAAPIEVIHNNRALRYYGCRDDFLTLLEGARHSVVIQNPYWGDRAIARKLAALVRRGVAVTLLVPERANITNDLNRRVIRSIYRETGGRAAIFLSDRMVHAKLIYIDGRALVVGSANLNRVALEGNTEVNLLLQEIDGALRATLEEHLERIRAGSRRVEGEADLAHSPVRAFIENLVQGS